ncbi:unnamed protein product [Brassica napus]|uniref:(rape) hypothetical protein n=1 Tax=Brassica napus TaxID=3708 RepID=A0A816JLA2_BRANA|nr:unnamed protein product [Brassica napus]
MEKRKIPVFCYWNGCIKDGPDGPFYQGSIPRVIRVESKTDLPTFLNDLRRVTGLETMLEVPSYHPSITNVEFYLEVKPLVSRPLPTNASSSANQASLKRCRQGALMLMPI